MSFGVDQILLVLRVERELYKLREIMRQVEQVVEVFFLQYFKLQKKFYGSELAFFSSKLDSGSLIYKFDFLLSLKFKKKKFVNIFLVKFFKVRILMFLRF